MAYGYEFLSKNLTNPLILGTAGATATLNAICATSQNPAKAMQVLEEFNTNVELYNLFARGIEAYYRDHKQVGAWEATKIMNDTAILQGLLFVCQSFNSTSAALWNYLLR